MGHGFSPPGPTVFRHHRLVRVVEGFPYPPRRGQRALFEEVREAAARGGHLVAEAATGTGKTVAALAALVQEPGRRVVWTTRTNSQQEAVVREHAALKAAGAHVGLLVPFMGRRNYCPLLRSDDRFKEGTAEELGRLCRDAKRKARQAVDTGREVEGACPYFARLLQDGTGPVEAILEAGGTSGEELSRRVEQAGSCTYEALKAILPQAHVVVVPRIYVLDDVLRGTLLGWMGTGPDGIELVVDEAHHLPDAAREHHTPRLSHTSLTRAQREAIEYKDPTLAGITLATTVVDAVMRALHAVAAEHVHSGDDGLVPPDAFEEALLMQLRVPTPVLLRIAADLETWGQDIRADRQAKGRLPRSYLGALGAFLHAWLSDLEGDRVGIVTGGDNPALERYLLHPGPLLSWLDEFWCTVHMSGTLAPLAEHVAQCSLPERTRTCMIPTPFDPDQLRIAAVDGMERRYEAVHRDPGLTLRQQDWASQMLGHWPGRCGVFFTSHQMLQDYLEEGFLHASRRRLFVEEQDMSGPALARLVDDFRRTPGAVLLGVLGGRLTEGIDFPGDAMEHMLLLGVPYPRPSARVQALIHYYDRLSGNGWSVAVHTPVGRVLRQAVGRLVRGPGDRGVAVVLDERAVRFHAFLPGLRMVHHPEEVVSWAPRPEGYATAETLALPHRKRTK